MAFTLRHVKVFLYLMRPSDVYSKEHSVPISFLVTGSAACGGGKVGGRAADCVVQLNEGGRL